MVQTFPAQVLRRVTLLLGVVVALSAAKPAVQASPRAAEHNNRGATYLDNNNFAQAEFELKTAVSLSPDYAEAYNNLGILEEKQQHYQQAIEYFSTASRKDPNYVAPLSHMGAVYIATGEYDRAIDVLRKATKKDPKFDFAFYNLGLAYLRKATATTETGSKEALLQKSEEALVLATQLNPRLAEAHIAAGELYTIRRDWEHAEIRFRLALEDRPQDASILAHLAEVLTARGKAQEIPALRAALDEKNRTATATSLHQKIASAMLRAEEQALGGTTDMNALYSPIRTDLQTLLQNSPRHIEGRYLLGVVESRLGHPDVALPLFIDVLHDAPQHPGALYNAGLLLAKNDKLQDALAYWCPFLQLRAQPLQAQQRAIRKHLAERTLACPTF